MKSKLQEQTPQEFRETHYYTPEQFEVVKTSTHYHPSSQITYQITEQSKRLHTLTAQQKEQLKADPIQKMPSSRLAAAIKLVEQNLSH